MLLGLFLAILGLMAGPAAAASSRRRHRQVEVQADGAAASVGACAAGWAGDDCTECATGFAGEACDQKEPWCHSFCKLVLLSTDFSKFSAERFAAQAKEVGEATARLRRPVDTAACAPPREHGNALSARSVTSPPRLPARTCAAACMSWRCVVRI